jgi:hypothetical protein
MLSAKIMTKLFLVSTKTTWLLVKIMRAPGVKTWCSSGGVVEQFGAWYVKAAA